MNGSNKENKWEERIEEWEFVACPTETQDPFFWRWTKEGLEVIEQEIKELLAQKKQRIVELLDMEKESHEVNDFKRGDCVALPIAQQIVNEELK